jgi:hypothetical protein
MYLVKFSDPSIEKCHLWIKISKNIFIIKRLTNRELVYFYSSDNVLELVKLRKSSLMFIKSCGNELFEGIDL